MPLLSFLSHKIGLGGDASQQKFMVLVSDGDDDTLEVWGYRRHLGRLVATLVLVLVTGILPLGLPLYWMSHVWLYLTQELCPLDVATTVLVVVRSLL